MFLLIPPWLLYSHWSGLCNYLNCALYETLSLYSFPFIVSNYCIQSAELSTLLSFAYFGFTLVITLFFFLFFWGEERGGDQGCESLELVFDWRLGVSHSECVAVIVTVHNSLETSFCFNHCNVIALIYFFIIFS